MRIAAFILVLLGALACATVGVVMKAAERRPDKGQLLRGPKGELAGEEAEAARAFGIDPVAIEMRGVDSSPLVLLSQALLATFPLAVLGGMLTLLRRGRWAGAVLLIAAAGPLVLLPRVSFRETMSVVVVATSASLLGLAGLSNFFLRPAIRRERVAGIEGEEEVPQRPGRTTGKRPRPAAVAALFLLFVGGAAALSLLVALDELRLIPNQPGTSAQRKLLDESDDPGADGSRKEDRTNLPPDPPLDPKEVARLETQRKRKLADLRTREKQALVALQALPPSKGSGLALCVFKGHADTVKHLAFSPDGMILATAGKKRIKLWNIRTGKALHTLAGHTEWIRGIAFSPDGRRLASVSEDKSIRLWDVETGTQLFGFTLEKQCTGVTFSPDGRLMLGGTAADGDKGYIKAWEVESGRFEGDKAELDGDANGLAYSADGRYLVCRPGTDWRVYDARTFQRRRIIETDGFLIGTALNPDGQTLAVASRGGDGVSLKLLELRTSSVLRTFEGDTKGMGKLAFSPDGKFLATTVGIDLGKDAIKLWDVATGKELRTLYGIGESIDAMSFSPGGTFLVTSGSRGVSLLAVDELFDTDTQKLVAAVWKFGEVSRQGRGFRVEAHGNVRSVVMRDLADSDLLRLKGLTRLVSLRIRFQKKVTDAGLAHLKGLTDLRELDLAGCEKISDAGMAHVAGLTGLTELDLRGSKVTDAGVARLRGLTALQVFSLSGTKITDAALPHLTGMRKLRNLSLDKTPVSKEAVEKLRKVLPALHVSQS